MSIMDVKLNQTRVNGEAGKASMAGKKTIFGFIQEMKDELKKVSWTTKEELRFSTRVVIWSTFIFGFGIYFIDLGIKGCLELIKVIIHFIFG